jgi:diguanylate cyclase (GGDEF)-like protein
MLGVLFLDVGHFKVVNDGRGHAAGDQLLVALARRLRSVVRPSDTVARFGGDEFVVMGEDLSGEDAVRLSERLLGCIAEPIELDGLELSVTVSLGVAVAGSEATADSLLRDADTAMYRAKETGRGHVEMFDQILRHRADHRLEVAGALRARRDVGRRPAGGLAPGRRRGPPPLAPPGMG